MKESTRASSYNRKNKSCNMTLFTYQDNAWGDDDDADDHYNKTSGVGDETIGVDDFGPTAFGSGDSEKSYCDDEQQRQQQQQQQFQNTNTADVDVDVDIDGLFFNSKKDRMTITTASLFPPSHVGQRVDSFGFLITNTDDDNDNDNDNDAINGDPIPAPSSVLVATNTHHSAPIAAATTTTTTTDSDVVATSTDTTTFAAIRWMKATTSSSDKKYDSNDIFSATNKNNENIGDPNDNKNNDNNNLSIGNDKRHSSKNSNSRRKENSMKEDPTTITTLNSSSSSNSSSKRKHSVNKKSASTSALALSVSQDREDTNGDVAVATQQLKQEDTPVTSKIVKNTTPSGVTQIPSEIQWDAPRDNDNDNNNSNNRTAAIEEENGTEDTEAKTVSLLSSSNNSINSGCLDGSDVDVDRCCSSPATANPQEQRSFRQQQQRIVNKNVCLTLLESDRYDDQCLGIERLVSICNRELVNTKLDDNSIAYVLTVATATTTRTTATKSQPPPDNNTSISNTEFSTRLRTVFLGFFCDNGVEQHDQDEELHQQQRCSFKVPALRILVSSLELISRTSGTRESAISSSLNLLDGFWKSMMMYMTECVQELRVDNNDDDDNDNRRSNVPAAALSASCTRFEAALVVKLFRLLQRIEPKMMTPYVRYTLLPYISNAQEYGHTTSDRMLVRECDRLIKEGMRIVVQ